MMMCCRGSWAKKKKSHTDGDRDRDEINKSTMFVNEVGNFHRC